LKIYDTIKRFVFDPTKVYVGASAGALLIGKKMFTESENDALYLSRFTDEGFGFFPDKLLEVHYDEAGNKEVLDTRTRKALRENPDLSEAYLLESDCCLCFKDFSRFEFETLRGKYHITKR
jgi:cyanophycinase-like exopeptidase